MDFHQKTLPQKPMKQATMHVHRNACTDYPHITAQCIYCVATIPISFQPHPPLSAPHSHTQLHTQYFLQHTPPSTIITIIYHPYILIHNHYIATSPNTAPHTTTLNLHRNVSYSHQNALRSITPTFTSTNQAEQSLTSTTILNKVDNTQSTLYQTHPHRPPLQRTCTYKQSQNFITLNNQTQPKPLYKHDSTLNDSLVQHVHHKHFQLPSTTSNILSHN